MGEPTMLMVKPPTLRAVTLRLPPPVAPRTALVAASISRLWVVPAKVTLPRVLPSPPRLAPAATVMDERLVPSMTRLPALTVVVPR